MLRLRNNRQNRMGNGGEWRKIEEAELLKIQMIGIELGLIEHLLDGRSYMRCYMRC